MSVNLLLGLQKLFIVLFLEIFLLGAFGTSHPSTGQMSLGSLSLLSFLCFTLCIKGLLNLNFPVSEFSDDLFTCSRITFHPRVGKNLTDGWSVIWVQLHASLDDLLELL